MKPETKKRGVDLRSPGRKLLIKRRLKNAAYCIVFLVFVVYGCYVFGKAAMTRDLTEENSMKATATIINETIPVPNTQGHDHTYAYSFVIEGTEYHGNSNRAKVEIGDRIEILYNERYPSINKPRYAPPDAAKN